MAEQKASDIYKMIRPLINADNERTFKRITQQINRVTNTVTNNNSGGGSADSAALAAHAALDWIEAHPTKDSAINRTRTYYSINFGIVGGAAVDESNNILAMLNAVGLAGGGTVIICAIDPADPIHFAKTVSNYYSNVHIVFPPGQLLTFEDKASLRIMGDYAQITRKIDGTAMKLHVASTVVSNETVLELSATDTALMDAEANPALRIVRVGDKIVVRGENDASGKSIEKDTSFVKALAKVGSYWQITCTDELDYTFQPTYPASEWPADLTTGTTIYVIEGSLLTVDSAVNDTSITVADGTVFTVGDLIEVGDNRNEYAMNSSAITGAGNPYKNPANLEQRQVVGISGNVLTLDNALVRSTSTTYYAFAALMVPVVNSTIVGARISYVADGIRSANALQITYALDCHIYDCYVDGSGGRKGHGLRISYSYKCTAHRNRIENPKYSGSGEGYGITIYYATKILVDHNYVSGCRHNFLLQLATESIVSSNYSVNDLISGIDLHGVRSKRCVIRNNHVTRSKLQDSDLSTKSGGIRCGNTSHSGGDDENLIEGNYISGYRGYNNTDGNGIDIFAASSGNTIRNNVIEHCYNGLRFGLNSKQITPVQFIDNTIVEGNVFRNCENRAVEIIAAPTYDNVNSNGKFSQITFLNNISDGNNRHFEFTGVITTLGITDVVCVGNQIINPTNVTTTYYGVSAQYVDGFVHVYDNNVSKAQRGIYLKGNGVCHVIGNKTANTVQSDPFTDGGGNTSVNYVDAMAGGGIAATIVDVKGDLIAATAADTVARLAAGANDTILIADSAQTTGLRWATPAQLATIIYTATNPLVSTANPFITNTDPGYFWTESDAASGSKNWAAQITSTVWHLYTYNDAFGSPVSLFNITRAGNAVLLGKIGIGTSTLTDQLNVTTTGTGGAMITANTTGTSLFSGGHALNLFSSNYTGGLGFLQGANGKSVIQAFKAATEDGELAINPNGGIVGINTASPVSGQALTVKGSSRVQQASDTRYRSDHLVIGGVGNLNAYDDNGGGAYIPLKLDGSTVDLRSGVTTILQAKSTGVDITGTLTTTGPVTDGNGGYRQHFSFSGLSTGTTVDILANNGDRAEGVVVYGILKHSAVTTTHNRLTASVVSGAPYNETMNGTDTFRMTCTSGGKVSYTHYAGSSGTFSGSFDVYWSA